MNETNSDQNPETHELVHDQMIQQEQRVNIEGHCTCGEKFLAYGSNESSAKEALLGKHIKHRREAGAVKVEPKEGAPWREGKEGIITHYDDILALDLSEGERKRRKELLESARKFISTLFRYEMNIEIWGDWLLFILSDLYSTSFDTDFMEGLETYRENLKRIRDQIDEWLATDIELPDDLSDIA